MLKSSIVKEDIEKAPHRSLFKALGLTDEELSRPLIDVINTWNGVISGYKHLKKITEAVKTGVRLAGGTLLEFNIIGSYDDIVMSHESMKYSLPSREIIANSIEIMIKTCQFYGSCMREALMATVELSVIEEYLKKCRLVEKSLKGYIQRCSKFDTSSYIGRAFREWM